MTTIESFGAANPFPDNRPTMSEAGALRSSLLRGDRVLAAVASGEDGLGPGSEGKALRVATQALKQAGYDLLPTGTNGRWHSELGDAVRAFQADANLDITGVFDTATVLALDGLLVRAAANHARMTTDHVIDTGDLEEAESRLAATLGPQRARALLIATLGQNPTKLTFDAVDYLQGRIGSMHGHVKRYQQVLVGHVKDAKLLDANFNGRLDADDLIFTQDAQGQVNTQRLGKSLRDQVLIGAAMVDAAYAMDAADHSFIDEDIVGNPRFWAVAHESEAAVGQGHLELRPGVSPSEALEDVFANPDQYEFECGTAIVILRYKAVLELIGANDFDRVCADMVVGQWKADPNVQALWEVESSDDGSGMPEEADDRDIAAIRPGDYAYFMNFDVSDEGAAAGWSGENVIALGNGLYYGHPFGVVADTEIVAKLNKHRNEGSDVDAALMDYRARMSARVLDLDRLPD